MKAKFKLDEIGDVEATLTLTMSLNQWINLKEQLSGSYPSWKLGRAIGDIVNTANNSFEEEIEPEM